MTALDRVRRYVDAMDRWPNVTVVDTESGHPLVVADLADVLRMASEGVR